MLLRTYLKDTPARQLIGLGLACMSSAALITVTVVGWIDEPTFLVGLLYGVAVVLAGLSIVFNVRGLKRLRDEQTDR